MRIKTKAHGRKDVGRNKPGPWQRGPRYWMAMSSLVAQIAVGGRLAAPLQAQDSGGQPEGPNAPEAGAGPQTARRFDIPSGPLEEVLRSFERAAGVLVRISEAGIGRLDSPGVVGTYTVDEALRRLLDGSGVVSRHEGASTIVLSLEGVSSSIDVSERAATVASVKYTEPLRDIPQSISVVPSQIMESQGSTTLRDALRNVAGISLAAGEGGAQGDNLTIRGFTARNDMFNDGMRDFGSYYRDPFNLEEVEVLKGPSSTTFGRGTTGGVVNQATKAPQAAPLLHANLEFGTDRTRRVTADINQPLQRLGPGAAFRLNIMANDSGVAGRDIAKNRRFGLAPSLALGVGTPTVATFNYFHQSEDDIPDYGIPWLFNGPAPVNRNNYYGFKDANYLRTSADIGTIKVEHQVSSRFSLRDQVRYANYRRDVQITEARVAGVVTLATPLSQIAVARNQIAAHSTESFLDNQSDLTARFRTGFLRHAFVSGVEASRETSAPTRHAFTGVPGTSLVTPDTEQLFTGVPTVSSRVRTTAVSVGAYAIDTISLGEHIEVSGGFRWDRFDADYRQRVAPVSAFSRVDEMPSWRGAFVYKPRGNGSIYFNYGTSFNPSAESLSLSASTANLPPEKNRTFETGSKWDLSGGRLSLRGALFRTEKQNAREPDPNNSLLNVLSGTQRAQGLELEATGRLTRRWNILSSYAYVDSELTRSVAYPTAVGSRLANVAANTFNLWNNIELPWRLSAGLGGQFVGSRTASSTVPNDPTTGQLKQVPGYWVFHAMARYPLSPKMDAQVNVYNLADRYYYDQLHPGHIVPGPGRSATVGILFKF